jgi:uncharacterized membrane protein required for colicin V production
MTDYVIGVIFGVMTTLIVIVTVTFLARVEKIKECRSNNNVYVCEYVEGYFKPVKETK